MSQKNDIFTYKAKPRFEALNFPPRKVGLGIISAICYKFYFYPLIAAMISALYAFIIPVKFTYNVIVFYVIIGINLLLFIHALYKTYRIFALFKYGLITYAELNNLNKEKLSDIDDKKIRYHFTFEYEINGQKYILNHVTNNRLGIGDELREPVVYNPDDADFAFLIDGFKHDINLDENGDWLMKSKKQYSFALIGSIFSIVFLYAFIVYVAANNYFI